MNRLLLLQVTWNRSISLMLYIYLQRGGGGDEGGLAAMSDGSEAALGPGWRRKLQEVAGCLRQLGLEVGAPPGLAWTCFLILLQVVM